jgi:hypothetical protein
MCWQLILPYHLQWCGLWYGFWRQLQTGIKVNRWLVAFLCVISGYCYAQIDSGRPAPVAYVPDTNVRVIANSPVQNTLQKVVQYQQLSHGTFPGYRVQVHFGQNRNDASQAKNDFSLKYPGYTSYLTYQPPYFKVCAGDFRNKLEAVKALNRIKRDYPGAFVVRDKINPPPLH